MPVYLKFILIDFDVRSTEALANIQTTIRGWRPKIDAECRDAVNEDGVNLIFVYYAIIIIHLRCHTDGVRQSLLIVCIRIMMVLSCFLCILYKENTS